MATQPCLSSPAHDPAQSCQNVLVWHLAAAAQSCQNVLVWHLAAAAQNCQNTFVWHLAVDA